MNLFKERGTGTRSFLVCVSLCHDNMTMNKLFQFGPLIFLLFLVQINAGDTSVQRFSRSLSKRAADCPTGAQGEPQCCIASDDALPQYEHTDERGNTCTCAYCRAPKYVVEPCVCTPGSTDGEVKCGFPDKGKTYMPPDNFNNCTVPLSCTIVCPGNLTLVEKCEMTKNSVCGCKDGLYQTGDTTCSEIPKCGVNFKLELTQIEDSKYTSYVCVPCEIHEHCPGDVITEPLLDIITGLFVSYGTTLATPTAEAPTPSTKSLQETENSRYYTFFIIAITLCAIVVLLVLCAAIALVCCRSQRCWFTRTKTEVVSYPSEIVYGNTPNHGSRETAV